MMDDFLSQLRTNSRLRWGLALILGIGWLYGVLVLRDSLQEQSQRLRAATQSIARIKTQLAQPEWASRAVAARAMGVQLDGRLWQAATPGLAQAAFQDWLSSTMVKSATTGPQVTVALVEDAPTNLATSATPPEGTSATPTDLWKIKAKLNFDFNAATLLDFLARMENNDKQIVVSTLVVRKEPAPRVELEVVAYFQKPAKAPGAN